MADCAILIGLPASGKTTFFREHLCRHPRSCQQGSHADVAMDEGFDEIYLVRLQEDTRTFEISSA